MRVLQSTKRSVTLLVALCAALAACGESGPDAPFNPSGTSEDMQALNGTFESPVYGSFATFSEHFSAAIGTSPLISASADAFKFRQATKAGELRAAAKRNAQQVAALTRQASNGSFSGSMAQITSDVAGKTFEYVDGSYVPTDLPGAPSDGVRFLIYAVNPITFEPVSPLQEVGYVEITDLSGSSTQAARVVVVSGETTYLDYTVSASAVVSSAQVVVSGFVTDGTTRANINLRSTFNESTGLSLIYTVDVPQRDVSIDLTMTVDGLDQETGGFEIELSMTGPNGTVSMSGQFSQTGGTVTVRTNGELFATIVSSGTGPAITGADGQPLSPEDAEALQNIFSLTGEAFVAFDAMVLPVGVFIAAGA